MKLFIRQPITNEPSQRMSNRLMLQALGLACLITSGCASLSGEPPLGSAQGEGQAGRIGNHFYAGTGIGASRLEPDASEAPAFTLNDRVEPAGQVTIGRDLSRQLAVELHSADLGSAGFSPGGRINYHIHGASALVYAGKNRHNWKRQGLSGYGRVGVGYLENTTVGNLPFTQENTTHLLLGAGVEYMTSFGLGLRAEGITFEEDAQYAQVGVVYRTGRRAASKPVEIAAVPEPVAQAPVIAAAVPDACQEVSDMMEGVTFRTDSSLLSDEAYQVLSEVAEALEDCSASELTISAHTDSRGSDSYNQVLSQQRAQAVATYLKEQGVANRRMLVLPYGESRPIDSNDTQEGRAQNRRVELIVR